MGRGSKEQVEDFIPAMTDDSSEGEMSVNEEKECVVGVEGSGSGPGGEVASWEWILLILSWKNVRNSLHF